MAPNRQEKTGEKTPKKCIYNFKIVYTVEYKRFAAPVLPRAPYKNLSSYLLDIPRIFQ